jgi:hypothetical protein
MVPGSEQGEGGDGRDHQDHDEHGDDHPPGRARSIIPVLSSTVTRVWTYVGKQFWNHFRGRTDNPIPSTKDAGNLEAEVRICRSHQVSH